MLIAQDYFEAPNILCLEGSLEKNLGLTHVTNEQSNRYSPISAEGVPPERFIRNSHVIYKVKDEELDVIKGLFFHHGDSYDLPTLPYLLNLPNTSQDVKFRQSGVKELVEKPELYKQVLKILQESSLFNPYFGHFTAKTCIQCFITPEKVKSALEGIISLEKLSLKSSPFNKLISWAYELKEDTLFSEIIKNKRKVTDARIIAVYSERHGEIRFGIIKPGIKPDDFLDWLNPALTKIKIRQKNRRGKRRTDEERKIVNYKFPEDKESVDYIVGAARQRMDRLNMITSELLEAPFFLIFAQLQHIYLGAYLHNQMIKNGYPSVFPEIIEKEDRLQLEEILPIRIVLNNLTDRYHREDMQVNTFNFDANQRLISIQGPNKRGKSEAWRTVHLFYTLANSGYPVPAKAASYMVIPTSHFIPCRTNIKHGGSDLDWDIKGLLGRLEDIGPKEAVILDAFGDDTNAPTSEEGAKQLIPAIHRNGNRIFVTTHHDSTQAYFKKEGGIILTPTPEANGIERFRLVPAPENVDFKPKETLEEIGFTGEKLEALLNNPPRTREDNPAPIEEYNPSQHEEDDAPF